MSMKFPAPLSRPRTLVASTAFGVALVSGAWMLQRGTTMASIPPVRGPVLFAQVRANLIERYIDSLGAGQLDRMAINGMLGQLGDPYSAFLPPDRLSRLSERTSGNYAGIGLQVDVRDGYVMVVNPLPGGPGERAGVLTGDRIMEIGGKVVRGWTPDEVQRLLRGAPGSKLAITVEHPGSPGLTHLTLTRAPIHRSAIGRTLVLPNNVGYIALKVFGDSTAQELTTSIDSLTRAGATSLILDVRGNPGGLLEQGVAVASLFLNPGQRIVSTRGRIAGATQEYKDSTWQRWPQLALSVLVDDKTASAAELFAGALQDHDRAVVLGTTTYGKGSAQTVFPMGDAGALKLTTARWYTPLGRSIARVDSTPDAGRADDTEKRPIFRTDGGRTVFGGGGITPDIAVGDTAASPENMAFLRAVGTKVAAFHDALTSFALAAKATHTVRLSDFPVTSAMLDDVYRRMLARRVDVPRQVYDEANALVSRLLAYEVNRYVFGAEAEFRRKAADDRVIRAATRVLVGVRSQHDALQRAAEFAKATNKTAG